MERGLNRGERSGRGEGVGGTSGNKDKIVKLRGMPFRVTAREISDFFKGILFNF